MEHKERWIERLKGPDREAAIEELRRLVVLGLQRSLGARGADRAFIEDMTQESLLKILGALDSFEGRSRFTTWAMAIAMRVAISELRRRQYKDVSLDSLTSEDGIRFEVPADAGPTVDAVESQQHVLRTLHRLIRDRLSEKQRTATLALLSGLPVEEIAERTGSNRNAVYKLIYDARQRLREGFEDAGITDDEYASVFE